MRKGRKSLNISGEATLPNVGPGGSMRKQREEPRQEKQFSVIIERDREGYYVASVPALRGCRKSGSNRAQKQGCSSSAVRGIGLHWEELDEDISVKGLLLGIGDRTQPARKAS
jgi:hypothetical protein